MRIIICVLLSCLITALLAADEHRPKKKEDRGKRNLEYNIAHHYSSPHSYRLERRISTGPQHPIYQSQFFPGPRPYSSYRKGRPYYLPAPPYAVQMEPLVHYSQRDPLYDTNIFSLNTDGHNDLSKPEDLLTDNNQLSENIYGPPHKHIVERPVYIKEPEPIIEIIIKESNVTLPPLPTAPPPKKKKEQVQVFYVKYKKNPNGHGKDSVIYDKPVPALTPPIPEDEEVEEPPEHHYHHEAVTAPPAPSTTLRTIIKPDSETYHSSSGVKVTFGKEGFDYDKRSSKPEDYHKPAETRPPGQYQQGRQLSSFSSTYYKRAPVSNPNFQSGPSFKPDSRQPQAYRPFNFPSSPQFKPSSNQNFGPNRPTPPQFQPQQNKYPFQSPPYTKPNQQFPGHFSGQYQQTISHPPPPQFQASHSHNSPPPPPQFHPSHPHPPAPQFHQSLPQNRQPVPYKPFDNLSGGQSQQGFPIQQQSHQHQKPAPQQAVHQHHPQGQQNVQFRPESHFGSQQQLPLNQNQNHNNFNQARFNQQSSYSPQFKNEDLLKEEVRVQQPQHQEQFQQQPQHHHQQQQIQQQQAQFHQHAQDQNQYNTQSNQPISQNEHLNNLQQAQNILPPGGELIHSLPKFEQHISVIEPNRQQQPQALPLQTQQSQYLSSGEYQKKIQEQFAQNSLSSKNNQQIQQKPHSETSQQQFAQQHQQQQFASQQQKQVTPQQESRQQSDQELLQQYYQQQSVQSQQPQNHRQVTGYSTTPPPSVYYQTTRKPSSSTRVAYQTTTTTTARTTTTEEPEKPSTTTKDPKILNLQLPDEVPDELRAQLLSSGILNNADISVLDYDKVGDIPLSALPPDQLANFYSAGGAQQISTAGSEPIPSIVNTEGKSVQETIEEEFDQEPEASENVEVKADEKVQMKVVHYDPQTDRGQQVQESYVKDDAKQVDPVVLNDNTYNRYLPLKVNGTQFPIPDVPELKGKLISSVVVLAPVAFDFSSNRKTRNANNNKGEADDLDLIQGDDLKKLLQNPTLENYKKFFESEKKARSDKQSVILLVTGGPKVAGKTEKEIYMYDIATQTVSKLSGELSSAFVDAAEANSTEEKETNETKAAASNIVETRVPYSGKITQENLFHSSDVALEESASDFVESKVPIIDPMDGDLETEASEQLESFVDISGLSADVHHDDLTAAASDLYSVDNSIAIGKTGRS